MQYNNFLGSLNIKQKILFLTIAVAISICLSSVLVSMQSTKVELLKYHKAQDTSMTDLASSLISQYKQQVESGTLTKAEAQKRALEDIRAIKYDGSNYFWINDFNNRFLAHPTKPYGYDAALIVDQKSGRKVQVEGTDIAKSQSEGFIETYYMAKQGESTDKLFPKLSFVRKVDGWDWVVGTGSYLDVVDEAVANIFWNSLFINIIITALVLALVLFTIIKDIVKSMNIITRDLDSSAHKVAAASSQLQMVGEKLSEGTTEQASSIQETSATLEESASMVKQNNINTAQAANLAKQSKESADKSNRKMQEMMTSMEKLKESSSEIGNIIQVIEEIAFQTNILALNAAVEAARAGEAGRGFAVVAEEVRNLAQRSAEAAKNTSKIIESNIFLSEKGVNIAQDVYGSLSEIDNQAKKVSELLDEISIASNEQTQGIDQINKAVFQMEAVVQANASNANQSAIASQQLSAQTLTLKDIVDRLNALVNGIQEGQAFQQKSYAKESIASTVNHTRKLTTSKRQSSQRRQSPESVIPLLGDDDF